MEPLLLLHGALGSAATFDPLRSHESASWQPIAFDFPGHGDAPLEGGFSIGYFAHWTLSFLEMQGIAQPVAIFGYSMGGYVALQMALLAPERVRCIATLGTQFDWTPETAAREVARLDPDRIAVRAPAFAATLAQRHRSQNWREVVCQTADLVHRLGHGEALGESDFRRVACPVYIGWGERDQMASREASEQVARWIPQGHFNMLADTPHPLEQVSVSTLARWLMSVLPT